MVDVRPQVVAAVMAIVLATTAAAGSGGRFEFQEATVDAIQLGFRNGSLTSTALVRFYLDRIARLNPRLHAVIEVNPDALAQAARADAERRASGGRRCAGGLHGVPVLLKDNIATRDRLNTTAGSLALLGSVVPRDAGVVARLRRAGAVILGKATLSEWSNFRRVEAGWSARGGQTVVSNLIVTGQCQYCFGQDHTNLNNFCELVKESLCFLGHAMRVELRAGCGRGGEHGSRHAGIRDRRLNPLPIGVQLRGWDQANARADQPVRRHPNHAQARQHRVSLPMQFILKLLMDKYITEILVVLTGQCVVRSPTPPTYWTPLSGMISSTLKLQEQLPSTSRVGVTRSS
jgi:hypothetical protein